jgi:hypothetical protein
LNRAFSDGNLNKIDQNNDQQSTTTSSSQNNSNHHKRGCSYDSNVTFNSQGFANSSYKKKTINNENEIIDDTFNRPVNSNDFEASNQRKNSVLTKSISMHDRVFVENEILGTESAIRHKLNYLEGERTVNQKQVYYLQDVELEEITL